VLTGNVLRWDGLAPGAYEVRDADSGLSTGPIDLERGAGPVEAVLDLSTMIRVSGRMPVDREDLYRFALLVQYEDSRRRDTLAQERGVATDGTFDLWFPRGRGVAIQPAARRRLDDSRVVGPARVLHSSSSGIALAFD
jgi:hypothetical protein